MHRRDQRPIARVVQRALDSLRIVLLSVLAALLYWQPGEPALVLDTNIRIGMGAAAAAYALLIVATWAMWSSRRWRHRSVGPVTLLLADYLVAVGILVASDPSTEVLTWIPFLFPIVSAAAQFGVGAAALSWIAISAVYLPIRMEGTTGDATREALEVGLRSVAALAVFGGVAAVSTAYLHRRLLEARAEMGEAERFAGKLGEVSLASRHLRAQSTTAEVLRGAVHNATRLGFADADVCERRESRPWSVTFTSRRGERPPADAELLSSAAVHSRGTVTRTIENHEENAQGLHIAARRAVMATPIAAEPGHWLVLRAWVHEDDPLPGHRDRQAFELLAAIVGDAWRNAQQMRNLEDRSKALAQQANHDALTGVANRGWMLRHLGGRLQPEYGPSQPTALLYVDLEGFKETNDAYGHEVGDRALVEVARRIRAVVPEEHSVGRLGGDEFLAVVDLATRDDPLRLAEAICATLGEAIEIDEASITIGASVGIALAEPEVEPEELIKRADAAVYVSRHAGGSITLQRTHPDQVGADPTGSDSVEWTEDFVLALESEAASLPSWAQDLVDAAEAAAQLAEALPDDWDVDSAGNPFGPDDDEDGGEVDQNDDEATSTTEMTSGDGDASDTESGQELTTEDAWLIALQDGSQDASSLDEMTDGEASPRRLSAHDRYSRLVNETTTSSPEPTGVVDDAAIESAPEPEVEAEVAEEAEIVAEVAEEAEIVAEVADEAEIVAEVADEAEIVAEAEAVPEVDPEPAPEVAAEPAPDRSAIIETYLAGTDPSASPLPVEAIAPPLEFPPYVVEPAPWPEGPVAAPEQAAVPDRASGVYDHEAEVEAAPAERLVDALPAWDDEDLADFYLDTDPAG